MNRPAAETAAGSTRTAFVLYAVGVLFDAGIVLVPSIAVGVPALTIGALHMCGQGLAMLVLAAVWTPAGLPRDRLLMSVLFRHARTPLFGRFMMGRCSIGMLLVAAALSGPSLTAVIYGAWPVGWALVLRHASVDSSGHRYQQVNAAAGVGLAAAFAGATLTVLAQPPQLRAEPRLLAAGAAVALAALAVDSQNSLSVTWGFRVAAQLGAGRRPGPESWIAVAGTGAACLAAGVAFWAAAATVEGVPAAGLVAVGLRLGAVTGLPPTVLSRIAMTRTTKSTVAAVGFATPAVTVVYLMLLGWLDDVRVGYLLGGVALVIAGGVWATRTHPGRPDRPHAAPTIESRPRRGGPDS